MKQTHTPRSSSLFLLELIFSILFFAVASALCVRIFVRAHLLSQDARALNYGVAACSNVAELVSASDSVAETSERILELYPEAETVSSSDDEMLLTVGLDRTLQLCAAEDAVYRLKINLSSELSETSGASMLRAETSLTRADTSSEEPIYQLRTVHYPGGGERHE